MSPLESAADPLVSPNVDATNNADNQLKTRAGSNVPMEPFLPSVNAQVITLSSSSPVRRIATMAALTAIESNRNTSA